jgi:hypothetical protein
MLEYYKKNEKRVLELDQLNRLIIYRNNIQRILE